MKRPVVIFGLLAATAAVVIGSHIGTTTAAPVSVPVPVEVINTPGNPAIVQGSVNATVQGMPTVKVFDHGAVFNRDVNFIDEQEWPASGTIVLDLPNILAMPFEIENVNAIIRLEATENPRYLAIEIQDPDGTKSRRYLPLQLQNSFGGYSWYVANESIKLYGKSSASVRVTLQRNTFGTVPTAIYVSVGGHLLQLPG